MFGQLTFMRLKSAEKALRSGRLDEAYRIATAPDLRNHKKAAPLVTELAERYFERARDHFRSDRFQDALMDLDRAEVSEELKDRIAELRGHVQAVAAEERRKEHLRQDRLQQAARRIQDGSLAAGRLILEGASENDLAAEHLRRVVGRRSEEVEEILGQAAHLIAQNQWAAAVARLKRARTVDAHHPNLVRLESDLGEKIIAKVHEALNAGRLARAADTLALLSGLAADSGARRELAEALRLAQEAAGCVNAGRYADARRHALALERMFPDASWVGAVLEQIRGIDELKTALLAGPLGERVSGGVPAEPAPAPRGSMNETVAAPRLAAGLSDRLLLLIDGGGSFLILRGPRATIGRAASSHPADVPVYSDLAEFHAEIARVDDDYFLISARDIEVGGKITRHELLRDGDRMVLGRKGKFTFRLPSRQSLSAAVDLSDTTKMPNDVRRVLLFHQHATIGNGPTAHIRVNRAAGRLVLFERSGALWLRKKSDGHADSETKPLSPGEPVEMAGLRLVLEPWKTHGSHGVV